MNIEQIYELIRRQAKAGLSPREADELADVTASQPKDVLDMQSIHDHTSFVYPTDEEIEHNWKSIAEHLNKDTQVKENHTGKRKIRTYSLLAIAASFVLLLSTFFVLQSVDAPTYQTSTEMRTEALVDGSEIAVNKDSEVSIAKGYGTKNRRIGLKGEAYIDAEKMNLPLIVESDVFDVEVVGTKFNVMDYEQDDVSSVSLYEGKIRLTLPNGTALDLAAGDHVSWNKISRTYAQEKITLSGPGWLEGTLRFDNIRFSEVFTILERNFDVEFEGTETIEDQHYNDLRGDQDLSSILDKIEKSTGVEFTEVREGRYRMK